MDQTKHTFDMTVDELFRADVSVHRGFIDYHIGHFESLRTEFMWHGILTNTEGEAVSIPRKMGYVSDEGCQERWVHAILKEKADGARISLTFRNVK